MHKNKVGLEAARPDETYRCHPAMYICREMSLQADIICTYVSYQVTLSLIPSFP